MQTRHRSVFATTPAGRPGLLAAAMLLTAGAVTAQIRPFRAIDLGTPIGQNSRAGVGAEGISPNGDHVAGRSVWEPFVWDRGTGMRALQKGSGHQLARANAVDDRGIAVGSSGTLLGGSGAAVWDLAGTFRSLHQAGWEWSTALGINNAGTVLVVAGVRIGGQTRQRTFIGPLAGPLFDLTPGAGTAAVYDINERGQICLVVDGLPFRYTPSIGLEAVGPFQPERINDVGQMVGHDQATGDVVRRTDGVGWQPLGRAPRGGFRDVGGIDAFGRIVVTEWVRTNVSPPSYAHYGHVFVDGLGWRKFDDLVDQSQQVRVKEVVGITDDGEIACWASIGSENQAALLEPRFVSVYGAGCPGGTGAAPKAIADGTPAAGHRVVLLGAGGRPTAVGAFVIATQPAAVALPGGCTLLVDLANAVAISVATNPAGQAHLAIDLPSGTPRGTVYMQFATVDPGAANGAFALSNGVRIDVQ